MISYLKPFLLAVYFADFIHYEIDSSSSFLF